MENKNLINNTKKYRARALQEVAQLDQLLKMDSLYLCVSRCYYAAFYSMKSVLENLGIRTSSHKQTQIKFRELFIKPGRLEKKYSTILAELFENRSKADYDIHWATNKTFVEKIVRETKAFVQEVLSLD